MFSGTLTGPELKIGTLSDPNDLDSFTFGNLQAGASTLESLHISSDDPTLNIITLKQYDNGNKCALFLNSPSASDPTYGIWREGSALNISSDGDIIFNTTPKVNDTPVLTSLPSTANFSSLKVNDVDVITSIPSALNLSYIQISGHTALSYTTYTTSYWVDYGDVSGPGNGGGAQEDGEWKDIIWPTLHIAPGFNYTVNNTTLIPSDDRLKYNEKFITHSSNTLMKIKPQTYTKKRHFDVEKDDKNLHVYESGVIAQQIWYDCPELRHLIHIGAGGTPADDIITSSDPTVDPDYSSWGPEPAAVNYTGFIPYLIKGFQEHHEENLALKKENAEMKAQIAMLMKAVGLVDSGNVESA